MRDQRCPDHELVLGSVDPQFILNLQPYKIAKEMRVYLKQIYTQENSARRVHLKHEISQYTQGSRTIQDYYSGFIGLWTEYTEIIDNGLFDDSLTSIQNIHKTSCRNQFLMKLQPEFENVRSMLMSRVPSPTLDTCLSDLQLEEQLTTQAVLAQIV